MIPKWIPNGPPSSSQNQQKKQSFLKLIGKVAGSLSLEPEGAKEVEKVINILAAAYPHPAGAAIRPAPRSTYAVHRTKRNSISPPSLRTDTLVVGAQRHMRSFDNLRQSSVMF